MRLFSLEMKIEFCPF